MLGPEVALVRRAVWIAAVSAAMTFTVSCSLGGEVKAPEPLAVARPLVAHWTFDEDHGQHSQDSSGNGYDALPSSGQAGLRRVEGVFGNAMSFSGRHMLQVPGKPDFSKVKKISLSAWTMPVKFDHYNEIFRKEDGENRVLFAFQEYAKVLSLGLNVGGYLECDAQMTPQQVLDGQWHHCAATFDGKVMRVYLDGQEIGSLKRPGSITAGGMAPGCIGSSNGGENFQGGMDDLRIYADALTPDEVARLYHNGRGSLGRMAENVPAGEPKLERPLLAHWTFNERAYAIRDVAGKPPLDVKASPSVPRTRGVYGSALSLSGKHSLHTDLGPRLRNVSAISFSAWAKPRDLSGYRNILRQEGAHRALFSFQENGTILSLGLDVGGYVEHDAKIEAARVRDGHWHHCAGTFDGQAMRVYLDGKEVGALKRAGKLAIGAGPVFIGSMEGKAEHYDGALDDLRIYGQALTVDEIARLHRDGREALQRYRRELEQRLQAFYAPGKTLAETLANSRRNVIEKRVRLHGELVELADRALRAAFPQDYASFAKWTGSNPSAYLMGRGSDIGVRTAGRLVELMVEYKPLTEAQWKRQTPEQRAK